MKGEDLFPSKYIKAADLKGRPHLVTISHCTIEKLGNDQKLITYFQGKEKGMVTNKTNFGRIAYLYGDETDDWSGAKIVLAAELVDFQGKPTMSIRVRAPNGNGQKHTPSADRITTGTLKQQTAAPARQQQIAEEEQQHDNGGDSGGGGFDDDIPFAPEWRG